jgi:hypothetical protein
VEQVVRNITIALPGRRVVDLIVTWNKVKKSRNIGNLSPFPLQKSDKRFIASYLRQFEKANDI